MAELIASTTASGTSADITVSAGVPSTIFLKSASNDSIPSDALAVIKIKSSGGQYYPVGQMTSANFAIVLDGPGTYMVEKRASATAFGVDQA